MTGSPERPGASERSSKRGSVAAAQMSQRARTASGLDEGVHMDGPVEESPYERLFTKGDTVMPKPAPLRVNTPRIILMGTACWAVFLLVTLLVPALHRGDRDWWPWMSVCGIVLGFIGWAYVRRGRGNAEAA